MELTILLAQLFGIFFLVGGLGVLLNRKKYHDADIDLLKMPSIILVVALFVMGIGLLIILKHNIWTATGGAWLVTLLGWIMFVKGALVILVPDLLDMFKNKNFMLQWYTIGGLVWIVAGAYLTYQGFFA
ncbi:MAG: hypothetical protein COU35_04335 [Candidatus Magasanikbacteria bacterium CG10_big_fil_rev_8_21_14_0_10_47_10]|uniref:Integral membrane protein (PIN domain superfamily) n=1 Tax=Candidatus Magasanikbacteria bacterium CG10_big_fil_rev_8_21_14_0_10_47_10 TaxID=1974652 RepID=A0A2H0TPH1_9BACT|nr:MAG: hypothetical protein COU35_04335 [Candidatus Magasanikbacteria bacterium CG10_big_fil_rev_8_21_14_0_10_47_10]